MGGAWIDWIWEEGLVWYCLKRSAHSFALPCCLSFSLLDICRSSRPAYTAPCFAREVGRWPNKGREEQNHNIRRVPSVRLSL